jgi:hypothetical protein
MVVEYIGKGLQFPGVQMCGWHKSNKTAEGVKPQWFAGATCHPNISF